MRVHLITIDNGPDPSNWSIPRTTFPGILILEEGQCHEEVSGIRKSRSPSRCVKAESGTPVAEVIRKMGITEPTFYRWKKQFAGMGVAEIRRLKQLEDENARLKKLVADLTPGQDHVAGRAQKKVVKPVVRREVAGHLQKAYGISERRACSRHRFPALLAALPQAV